MGYNKPYIYFCMNRVIYHFQPGQNAEPFLGNQGYFDTYQDGSRDRVTFASSDLDFAFAEGGDVFIADAGNHAVRYYNAQTEQVSTLTGNTVTLDFGQAIIRTRDGAFEQAEFSYLTDIEIYPQKELDYSLLLVDSRRLRIMTPEYVTTLTENTDFDFITYHDKHTLFAAGSDYIYRIDLDMPKILEAMQENPVRHYEAGEEL